MTRSLHGNLFIIHGRRLLAVLCVASLAMLAASCSDDGGEDGGGTDNPGDNQDDGNNDDLRDDLPPCNEIDNPGSCGGWICYEDERGRVCEQSDPERPDERDGWICDDETQPGYTTCWREDDAEGGSGRWRCRDGDNGERVCTSDDPGGDDEWDCEYTDEGVDCTRSDEFDGGDGTWDCYDDAEGTHCSSDDPQNANDDPGGGGWECYDDGDTRRCDDDHDDDQPGNSRDNPDGGPGWDCYNDTEGRHCHRDETDGGPGRDQPGPEGHDTPDGSDDWDCITREDERECTSTDDPDGGGDDWDCYYDDANGRTVCTEEPDTPDDSPGWDCYEVPEEDRRICIDDDPEDPGEPQFNDCGDPTGNVNGRVCAPSGDFWIIGATVSVTYTDCNGDVQVVETLTDAEGYFVLSGVPEGDHTVQVRKGPYEASYRVSVTAGQTTTIPLGDFCFDQSTAIAVVTGQYDKVETVLDRLGFEYTLFEGFPENNGARELLGDLGRMNDFDVIFLNCGTVMRGIFDDRRVLDTVRSNLETYVTQGGRVYASDWNWLFIEEPFPDAGDFAGEDRAQLDVLQGAVGYRPAKVTDPELLAALGEENVTLNFDYPEWAIMEDVGPDTRVFLRSDILTVRGGIMRDVPILMSKKYGDGEILFTSYHIHRNETIRDIFSYTVLGFD